MPNSRRYYIFTDGGPLKRIPLRVVNNLAQGRDSLPEFANTSRRVLLVEAETEGGQPVRIVGAEGSIWHFDENGSIRDGLQRSVIEAMTTSDALRRASGSGPVVPFAPKQKREKWWRENRWDPTKEDFERVIGDFELSEGKRAEVVTGSRPRHPPLTYEAKEALHGIEGKFAQMQFQISSLSEPALKGMAFEARERGREEPSARPLLEGLATACDRECDVRRQRRRKGGVWFAVVDVFRLDETRNSADVIIHKSERCIGRDAAKKGCANPGSRARCLHR